MVKVKEDLTGRIFGRWRVIEQTDDYIVPSNGAHEARWLCECSCDKHTLRKIIGNILKKGESQSCGCLKREKLAFRSRDGYKSNIYDLSGEYGIGWTTNTNREFYFDLEDYDKIKDYCWSEMLHSQSNYSCLVARDKGNKEKIMMHNLIKGKFCDHIDRNPMNNRKDNLREATQSQQCQNRNKTRRNKSGFVGVCYNKKSNKWYAYISIDKKHTHLGGFNNKEEAIKVRLEAEAKYYGDFAPQRHLFERYEIKTPQNDCIN